jgi:hypothetical protein
VDLTVISEQLQLCLSEVADAVHARFPHIVRGLGPPTSGLYDRWHVGLAFSHDTSQQYEDVVVSVSCWTVESALRRECAEFVIDSGTGEEFVRLGPVDLPSAENPDRYLTALRAFAENVCAECRKNRHKVLQILDG